jgi:DNA repair exonuclease SbcCD ATPase subunit
LLRQAEALIVANANPVLDRISSGMLRLDLREHTSSGVSPKALDLVAYNAATGTAPLRVASLSGSQRFRVAVSLALGIGQYASAGSHRVESVIIDEGFGSLDKEGRYEMIDELHALRDMLRCVILVSHQEEFASAFNNSYTVQIVDGSSTVHLLAG